MIGYPPSSSGTDHMIFISSVTPVSSVAFSALRVDSSIVGRPGGLDTPIRKNYSSKNKTYVSLSNIASSISYNSVDDWNINKNLY